MVLLFDIAKAPKDRSLSQASAYIISSKNLQNIILKMIFLIKHLFVNIFLNI